MFIVAQEKEEVEEGDDDVGYETYDIDEEIDKTDVSKEVIPSYIKVNCWYL